MGVTFLDKTYTTQKEFECFVKKLIYEDIGVCDDVETIHPTKFNILIKILERHPDFFSKTQNMEKVKLIRDTFNKNAIKVIIVKDGIEEAMSWKCAITGKHKTKRNQLMSAMRSSVDEQIKQFRYNNKKICVLCYTETDLQVDHFTPPFNELASNFITNINTNVPITFGECNDNTHMKSFLEIDSNFKNEWVDYHYKNASLRMLCKKCNLSTFQMQTKKIS